MLQSLRARLAFLFAGTLVLATVIAAVVVVSLYQSYNQDQTVSQLRNQVAGAASVLPTLFDKSRTGKVRGPQVITSSTFETVPPRRSSTRGRRSFAVRPRPRER